jgi:predicted MFS family arabinose efflux permease
VTQNATYPATRTVIWPMALLFLGANLYSIDRSIVGVLAEPIRKSFALGDAQMGLLLGLAYSLLSAVLGLGLGWLVDHRTRSHLVAGAIALWSVATIACGLAPNFQAFFVARMVVGLGEAAIAPAALSLVADFFPQARRGRGMAVYFIGASIGSGLSSVIPGAILRHGLALHLPGLGALEPWRSAFVLCGLAGPVVSLLLLSVREPIRQHPPREDAPSANIAAKLGALWQQKALIVPLYLGFCLFYVALLGITLWTAAFLGRRYGLPITSFSGALGLMLLATGMGGYVASGLLADSRVARGGAGRIPLLVALPLLGLPAAFATFAPDYRVALVLLGSIGLAMPMINVTMNTTLQDILPNAMRGFGAAMLGLASSIIAGAGGPWIIAMASAATGDLGHAFMVVGLPFLLASSGCFALAWRARLATPSFKD